MIYKIDSEIDDCTLEFQKWGGCLKIKIINHLGEITQIHLTEEQLFNFIGVLHSIKAKIKQNGGA